MKQHSNLLAILVLVGLFGAVGRVRGEEALDPRIAQYDKGPATIDVSKYPTEMQENYKLFNKKCTQCHTLARPINCEFALEDEWERYVKRMMRKPNSGISSAEAKKIFEFLAYDSKTRKKELYEKRLKEQPKTQTP
jgi:hypothetical protein